MWILILVTCCVTSLDLGIPQDKIGIQSSFLPDLYLPGRSHNPGIKEKFFLLKRWEKGNSVVKEAGFGVT